MTNGTKTLNFTYNADGLRTQKIVDGVTTNYLYGPNGLTEVLDGTNVIKFAYSDGKLALLYCNGAFYFDVLNAQGDVTALLDEGGPTAWLDAFLV